MSPMLSRIVQLLGLVALQAALLFVSAGTPRWAAGWLYIGLYVFMLLVASFFILPNRREVVEERSRGTGGGQAWDKLITRLMAVPALGLLLVAGLDERWGWTPPLPAWLRVLGALAFAAGYALVVWAMYSNKYFSQIVRIQTERGHEAVAEGPYGIIRHPGYLGMTASMLGSVFLLDSIWGMTCFAAYLAIIIVRTALEDSYLRAELPGYEEYSRRTRFRLLPGIW
jgi:protein-S-isoprenylcysteine O-methyltransferase Ste14